MKTRNGQECTVEEAYIKWREGEENENL
jgi:hypothetical protein